MEINSVSIRLIAKTAEQSFLQTLEQDYRIAPRVAEAILADVQVRLLGGLGEVRPGQVRKLLVKRGVGHGQKIADLAKVEVIWTLDGGLEDQQVLQAYGRQALRQMRILRLLDEAVEQGAVATQEDIAQMLNVTPRTIKRDFIELQLAGHYLPCRGNLQGIGRGQTHKAQIVGRWLKGETYDQIARNTHHAVISVQRYVRNFVQVIQLVRQGLSAEQCAQLLQIGLSLVKDYQAIYEQHSAPECRERLEKQLERFQCVQKGAQ
jgi:DNA-binding CsgD family transcriptional regulator